MFPLDRHQQYLVPRDEIYNRIGRLQKAMKEMDLALCWIDHPVDRYYFTGSAQDAVLMIPGEGEPVFFVRKSFKRAEVESPIKVSPFPGRRGLIDQAKELVAEGGGIGLSLDVSPSATYLWLNDQLAGNKISDISMALRILKSIKSDWEIAQIREAGKQAELIFAEMGSHVKVGQTELELSGSIEQSMRAKGHPGIIRIRRPGMVLATICAVSGNAGLYPTNFDGPVGGEAPCPMAPAGAGWKRVEANEMLMLDMVTAYNGYHADNARTFFTGQGPIPSEAAKAHDICRGVNDLITSEMKPGAECTEIFARAQSWVDAQGEPEGFMGYEENRVKFFGHGVGLELDEFPIVTAKLKMTLKQGMVVAVEPKAFLKGIGPVGVENTNLITATGSESLCGSPLEIVRL